MERRSAQNVSGVKLPVTELLCFLEKNARNFIDARALRYAISPRLSCPQTEWFRLQVWSWQLLLINVDFITQRYRYKTKTRQNKKSSPKSCYYSISSEPIYKCGPVRGRGLWILRLSLNLFTSQFRKVSMSLLEFCPNAPILTLQMFEYRMFSVNAFS